MTGRTWMDISTGALALAFLLPGLARAQGEVPSRSWAPDQLHRIVSPEMGARDHNQPSMVNGYLLLAGNGYFEFWDIADPTRPEKLSELESPHNDGEAESHTVSFHRRPDGTWYAATISGIGIDLWDITDPTAAELLSSVTLEGIDYGDNTNAVWGVFWQGEYVFVGGTNTGLHVVDASEPTDPSVVTRLPLSALGGVLAGPVFAVGNLLVTGTPKSHAGIATVDISDPDDPAVLDFVHPDGDSYIGWFYGRHAYLLTPFRTYDVTSDPASIELLGSDETPDSEYLSFGDGLLFLGALRPDAGVFKMDPSDPNALEMLAKIDGRETRLRFNDDQFPLPVGNLLVMSDDELDIGSVIAVHDTRRDTQPPEVAYVNPPDGATGQALTSRVGLSFTDQVAFGSVTPETLVVRSVGGEPLDGSWGHMQTVVTFWPSEPLAPETTYEVVLPAGGVTDLVGNPIAEEFRSVFSTGADVTSPDCTIASLAPVAVGQDATLEVAAPASGAIYGWDYGDGDTTPASDATSVTHSWEAPGRYPVRLTVEQDGARRTCSATQIVHRALTDGTPTRSSAVIVDDERGRAWTVNPDAGTVTAVDTETHEVVFEVDAGAQPRTLAQGPDGNVWVAAQDDDEIRVLDPDDGGQVGAVALRHGAAPYGVALSPDGSAAWVTAQHTGELVRIDTSSREVTDRVALGPDDRGIVPKVRGMAVTHDGGRVLVTRFVSPKDRGEVYDVSAGSLEVTRVIALEEDPGPDEEDSGRGVPSYISSVAISPDGARAWVPSLKANTARGLARDGEELTPDNTVRTIVSSIDLEADAEVLGERVDLDDHDSATAATYSPAGDLLFVATQGTNQVDVLDAYTGEIVAGMATGLAPQGLALSGSGKLFVQDFMSRALSVFDVAGIVDGTDGAARRLASVPTVAEEPLDDDVLLGKQIFYNGDDPRMSEDGYLSCASCHLDGGSDERVWDFTDRGEGVRNTIDLRGKAGTGHGPVHWTANFDEIQDFENDIRMHFGGRGLLSDEHWEAEDRSDPLGAEKAGLSDALDALAAYVTSLDEFPKSPYRNADGSMTDEATEGKAIFESLDCLECHAGERLTDSGVRGLHDVGTIDDESGSRRGETLEGFDTPTLRGVWATAPYLHDGSAATLREVVDDPEHGNAADLSEADKTKLIAFLRQIENEELGYEEPTAGECDGGPCPDGGDGAMGEGPGGCGCGAAAGGPGAGAPAGGVLAGGALAALLVLAALARRRRG